MTAAINRADLDVAISTRFEKCRDGPSKFRTVAACKEMMEDVEGALQDKASKVMGRIVSILLACLIGGSITIFLSLVGRDAALADKIQTQAKTMHTLEIDIREKLHKIDLDNAKLMEQISELKFLLQQEAP